MTNPLSCTSYHVNAEAFSSIGERPSGVDWHCAGIPRMLIDIRHEASHNELPALPLLRTAAKQALAWLQASYWQLQIGHLLKGRQQTAEYLEVVSAQSHDIALKDLPCACKPSPVL